MIDLRPRFSLFAGGVWLADTTLFVGPLAGLASLPLAPPCYPVSHPHLPQHRLGHCATFTGLPLRLLSLLRFLFQNPVKSDLLKMLCCVPSLLGTL